MAPISLMDIHKSLTSIGMTLLNDCIKWMIPPNASDVILLIAVVDSVQA